MSNGEGTCENLAKVASPNPLDLSPHKSVGGDDSAASSPHYSSCGDSEHERYCSANSVLGTPSICSSIATFNDCFVESEFGSLKSGGFGYGEDFENFNLEGSQEVPSNRRIGFRDERIHEDSADVHSQGAVISKSAEECGSSCLDTELREEDGISSRCDHSEGEDSMYNYGADEEHRNISYCQRTDENENENPLLINSSVAFGSNDWDDFEQEAGLSFLDPLRLDAPIGSKKVQGTDELRESINNFAVYQISFPGPGERELVEEVKDIPVASYHSQIYDEVAGDAESSSVITTGSSRFNEPEKDVRNISVSKNQLGDADDDMAYLENCSVTDIFAMEQDPVVDKAPLEETALNTVDSGMLRQDQSVALREATKIDESQALERQEFDNYKEDFGPLTDRFNSVGSPKKLKAELVEECMSNSNPLAFENVTSSTFSASADSCNEHSTPVKTESLEPNNFYDEFVHEMEEILLDSVESPGARFSQGNRMFQPQLSSTLRDGGATASTSGAGDAYPLIPHIQRIDGVEVIGAKQKKGDVSLSERLVGVKEYTVYRIRVLCGKDQWEVERRYRDFCTLYRRLKSFFSEQGWALPPSWFSVEKESRKIFGNASPDVIAERSTLIQECLCSIIHSRSFSSLPSALIWFLSPQDSVPGSPASNTLVSKSTYFTGGADTERFSSLGRTISLIVEVQPPKPMKQMLEAQHYSCAGCHKHFDDGMTLIRDFVQTFGWGKPRLCEYTGQLFCSSCHTNETAVLPARVLHSWDFTPYPVSQLAKSYLDSIHDQPMLCVSAVNPFLFSKVPALQHLMGIRKKIGSMLPYVRCPFRRSINKGLGSRRYLLESNDFFALKDLIDLSKGAFAALPVMVETVLRKIQEHITEQCLICCDVGVPCSARQACNDPSSLIFPFQEGEIEKCTSCGSVFHKPCFRKVTSCPCGAQVGSDEAIRQSNSLFRGASFSAGGALDLLGKRSSSELPVGFLSGLFSKTKPERMMEHKDSDNIILMGSLPSTLL